MKYLVSEAAKKVRLTRSALYLAIKQKRLRSSKIRVGSATAFIVIDAADLRKFRKTPKA
jgi:hypothetical protein